MLWPRLRERVAAEMAPTVELMEQQHVAAAHLTPAEWAELGQEGMAGTPKDQLPRLFGSIMYDADPATVKGMLAHAPLLPRLMLPIVAPRAYARYARRVYGGSLPARS